MIKVTQIVEGKMGVCSYIVWNNKKDGFIIDPSSEPERIYDFVIKKNLKIKAIINTHGHGDHTCGNSYIADKTGALIYLHKADAVLAAKFSSKFFSRMLGGSGCPAPDYFVEDNEILELGDLRPKIIHTPGHTPGGICILIEDNVFTGDTLFAGGIGRTDISDSSLNDILSSITKKLYTLPEETIVWPGHYFANIKNTTIKREKFTNPYTLN